MRWVTYLSPSGGDQRPGVIDDGDVFGYPGTESLAELLAAGADPLAAAQARALAAPVEIIVAFEARLCSPLRPTEPVPVVTPDGERVVVPPEHVGGPDDGIPLPDAPTYQATAGVVDFCSHGRHVGRSLACLWSTGDAHGLTVGGILASGDDLPNDGEVTVEVDTFHATAPLPPAGATATIAQVLVAAPRLERGEELFIGDDTLGQFEIRVGAVA